MKSQSAKMMNKPRPDDVRTALSTLEEFMSKASISEIADVSAALPRSVKEVIEGEDTLLSRDYPANFHVNSDYRESLPDLQNGPSSLIRGAKKPIQHVGISNFRLPIQFRTPENGEFSLETSVTGTVSLEANKKGINMSRIMRSFYRHAKRTFSFEVIEAVLDDYKSDLKSLDARIQMRFSFPLILKSLRSGLSGYQYYDMALEVIETNGIRQKIIHLDYVYSSTCPCSLELAEHARSNRGQLATPHSQRSVARISVEVKDDTNCLWFEELIA
ncbi:MAG: GTP cyclohydrolase, FolE2/MptA family, partial [Aestuariivita sp.]|nr:GTP cyclohydrolase, FolE2/MptA family [Aestuariivita sp.]